MSSTARPILFVTATWPHPVERFRQGVATRMRLLLRALQELGPLDLLLFVPWNAAVAPETGATIQHDLQRFWGVAVRSVRLAPSRAIPSHDNHLLRGYLLPALHLSLQPDYARVSGPQPGAVLREALAASRPALLFMHKLQTMGAWYACAMPKPPTVLDLDDVEHRAFERILAQPPHWGAKRLRKMWLPTLRQGERRAVRTVQRALVCSDVDRAYLQDIWGLNNVRAIPNALPDPGPLPPPPTGACTALFVGLLSYEPNRMGAGFLVQQVWPLVRQQLPEAQLCVAGAGAQGVPGFNDKVEGVRFLGFVDDLRAVYQSSHVVCSPIFSGGGTRVKIIEAALHSRPVVSTRLGAEGLALLPERGEITFAEDAPSFAREVVRLLLDQVAAQDMGAKAHAAAQRLYTVDAVLGQIRAELVPLLHG